MSEYFDKFPILNYKGQNVRDISRRVAFMKNTLADPFVFLPYTIEEGDKAEDVAYYYYGSTEYTWLVYLANNIIDPYHDWPLTQENFDQYLIKKYAAESGRKGYDIIDWTQNQTSLDNVLYYYKEVDDSAEDVGNMLPPEPSIPEQQTEDYNNTTVVIDGVTYTLVRN